MAQAQQAPTSESNDHWLSRDQLTGSWGGLRETLAEQGVTIDIFMVQDFFGTFSGGIDHGSSYSRYAEIDVGFDLDQLIGVSGLTGFASAYHTAGRGLSSNLGDFQGASNIENSQADLLAELWMEQILFDGAARLKLGKVDANSEFAFTENGGEFLNSSMGFSPTIFALPTFPEPAWAALIALHASDQHSLRVGLFDGSSPGKTDNGTHGPSFLSERGTSAFWIAEADTRWGSSHPGHLGLGGWIHGGSFGRFDGGTESDASGTYLVLDQHLWSSGSGLDLAMFLQSGLADEDVSEVAGHLGFGAVLSDAPNDQSFGMAASLVELSNRPGAGFTEEVEVAIETFWLFHPTPWLNVKPDLQYIINPGGDASVDPALALGVRLEWNF